jgi:adenylate cyclase
MASLRWVRSAPSWLAATLVTVGVAGAVVALRAGGLLEPLELGAYDRLLRWTRPSGEDDPRVVLVVITERDIQKHGHPLSDALLGRALGALARAGPRAIGVDLYRDRPLPPGTAELERLVRAHPEIVLTEKLGDEGGDAVSAPAYVAGTDQVGFSDAHLDRDGRVRRALLLMHGGGVGGISLSAQVAFRYLAAEGVRPRWLARRDGDLVPTLALGDAPLARFAPDAGGYAGQDAGGYQVLLAHPRGRQAFASLTLDQVLAGAFAPEAVQGRAVLLGTTAESVHDLVPTPFGETFGIEHHAQVVSELLDRALGGASGMRALPSAHESALVLVCAAAGALLAARVRSPFWLPAATLAALAGLALGSGALFAAGWWLPLVPASLAFALSGGAAEACLSLVEERDRQRVMDLFGRFLAREVAAEVWRDRDEFLDGGRPRAHAATLTVMMTDLAGYTAVSESLDPERLMEWIGEYLEAIARAVGAHGGVVDDFAGDGVKANFGVPLPRRSEAEVDADARAAVACALALEAEIERLNRRSVERGYPAAQVRVGLHTGPAVVGVIGSAERMKFTSVGDTVNTAARLERWHADEFRAEEATLRVLASGDTTRRLGGAFVAEPLGKAELKGKAEPVAIYRIRGRVGPEGEA